MSMDLDRVRELRPEVARPSETARQAAYTRLLEAMDDEPKTQHDRHGRRGRRHSSHLGRRINFGTAVAIAGSVVTIAVVVAAIALLGHSGRSTHSPASVGSVPRGAILARDGQILVTGGTARYPFGELAAQTLGIVSASRTRHTHTSSQAGVGQTGLEAQYQSQLAAGETVQTSIDPSVQRAGERSLRHSIAINHGTDGAFVVMSPRDGSIYAMGSNPTFNPSRFARGISSREYRRLTSASSHLPLSNRAIQSTVPVGSVFTPITAAAALQSGQWSPGERYDDTGTFTNTGASRQSRYNSGGAAYGVIDLQSALQVADNDFFYNLGARTNVNSGNGGAIQTWARKFGIGEKPRVDLPAASTGVLPSPRWLAQRDQLESECERATGPYRYTNRAGATSATPKPGYHRNHPRQSCGITDGRPWSIGDNLNLAIGQGDIQASPLQIAAAYSAIANGGTLVRPHVASALQHRNGTTQRLDTAPRRNLGLDPANLVAIQNGLRRATTSPGTSADVFHSFPKTVYGQAGTAQYLPTTGPRAGQATDDAWYAGYVPATATHKPVVVVVWLQGGGFGDEAAAPVARQILSQWFTGDPGPYKAGASAAF